jgi:hypothetical protein
MEDNLRDKIIQAEAQLSVAKRKVRIRQWAAHRVEEAQEYLNEYPKQAFLMNPMIDRIKLLQDLKLSILQEDRK